eukprot:m.185651 g.185651  ORF g.185651 m.185651 type:complete len:623 (+) comp24740_c0_seq5:153-2021(+)
MHTHTHAHAMDSETERCFSSFLLAPSMSPLSKSLSANLSLSDKGDGTPSLKTIGQFGTPSSPGTTLLRPSPWSHFLDGSRQEEGVFESDKDHRVNAVSPPPIGVGSRSPALSRRLDSGLDFSPPRFQYDASSSPHPSPIRSMASMEEDGFGTFGQHDNFHHMRTSSAWGTGLVPPPPHHDDRDEGVQQDREFAHELFTCGMDPSTERYSPGSAIADSVGVGARRSPPEIGSESLLHRPRTVSSLSVGDTAYCDSPILRRRPSLQVHLQTSPGRVSPAISPGRRSQMSPLAGIVDGTIGPARGSMMVARPGSHHSRRGGQRRLLCDSPNFHLGDRSSSPHRAMSADPLHTMKGASSPIPFRQHLVRRESATHGAGKTRVTLLKRSQSVPVPMMLPSVSDNRSRGDNLACMIPTLSHRGSEGSARYISVETCSDVVNGKFEAAFDNTLVIDCRFPFEYEAGHIKGAINAWTHEMITAVLFNHETVKAASGSCNLVLLHCEFSSHRAPRAHALIRSIDRQMNSEAYPRLTYPEVYVIEGGYEKFFEKFADCCEPKEYVLMKDSRFGEDCTRCIKDAKRSKARVVSEMRAVVQRGASALAEAAIEVDGTILEDDAEDADRNTVLSR